MTSRWEVGLEAGFSFFHAVSLAGYQPVARAWMIGGALFKKKTGY